MPEKIKAAGTRILAAGKIKGTRILAGEDEGDEDSAAQEEDTGSSGNGRVKSSQRVKTQQYTGGIVDHSICRRTRRTHIKWDKQKNKI